MSEPASKAPEVPNRSLSGKTALVTGASSGLGKRFAQVLAAAGAHVIVTARRTEKLEALVSEIQAGGGTASARALDVSSPQQISAVVDSLGAEVGDIDVLVNNAGMNIEGLAVDVTPETYDLVMNTNLRGAYFVAVEVARRMIERGQGGSIINIASVSGEVAMPALSLYCMSKSAVAMMTRVMAREWARHKINVNALSPGYIETELNDEWFASEGGKQQIKSWPRRRLMEPQSLDGMLLFLASEEGAFTTGSILKIDDGQYI